MQYTTENNQYILPETHVNVILMKFPSVWIEHRAERGPKMRIVWLMLQTRRPLHSLAGTLDGLVQSFPGQ